MSVLAPPAPRAIILVAGGQGTRLGQNVPKAFVQIGGESLLTHAVRRAVRTRGARRLIVVVPAAQMQQAPDEVRAGMERGHGIDPPRGVLWHVVRGGAERSDSVRAGLAWVQDTEEVVLVHDVARCFAPTELFDRVAESVDAGHPAVIPGMPVADTIKVVDAKGRVQATPERASLRAIQTPQGFARETLQAAHASGLDATDDAGLVERSGVPVLVVGGETRAEKITTPEDLERAEHRLSGSA